jgi:hypothetical protein
MSLPAVASVIVEPITPDAAPAPPAAAWSLPRRIGFRFVFAFVALWLFPFPLSSLPLLERAFGWVDTVQNAAIVWAGHVFLHRTVDVGPNGSGDSTGGWLLFALQLALALIATAVWSLADRRRTDYARLSRWLHAYLRFGVGVIMIGYGLAKVFHSQFPFPSPSKLEQPYGDASPMGLLWTFMGFSGPYNVFTGLAETVPAVLLFFRRTATIGALLLVAVMANVVMLNFCYDVPVKIFSTQLMLASLYIAGPRLRALFDLLARHRAVAAAPIAPLFARRRLDLAAQIVGVAFGAYSLGAGIVENVTVLRQNSGQQTAANGFRGNWLVDSETRDGTPVPADEPTRWRKLGVFLYKSTVRMDYHELGGHYDRIFFTHDPNTKTLALDPEPGQPKSTWSYAQADPDHLTINAVVDGKSRVLALHRDDTKHDWRLVTRGFHWVNESPYNR